MLLKNINNYFLFILLGLTLFNCSNNKHNSQKERVIKDMLNRTVSIPDTVQSVICVKPGCLRILSYLKAGNMAAGVEEYEKRNTAPYNLANPQYKKAKIIGPMHGGDPELITAANPDIIFTTYTTVNDANRLQNQTGIPVIALQYGDPILYRNEFLNAIKLMGEIINKKERADTLISFINNIINELDSLTHTKKTQEAYIGGVSFKGVHGISSTSPQYPPFEFVNVKNIAAKYTTPNNNIFIDKEEIIKLNPELLFIDYAGVSIIRDEINNPAFKDMQALKNNNIYYLYPYNSYTTNYATVFVNAYISGKTVYPDIFSHININNKAGEIYKMMLGKNIFNEFKKQFNSTKLQ